MFTHKSFSDVEQEANGGLYGLNRGSAVNMEKFFFLLFIYSFAYSAKFIYNLFYEAHK